MANTPIRQVPTVYHRKIGDIVVTTLSDGVLKRTHEMMRDVPEDEANIHLANAFRSAFKLSINAFLIFYGSRYRARRDGSGNYLGPEAGKLLGNLSAAGVSPNDIDTVLLRHMQPDHSAGLTNTETGQANYPNAELIVHENEPKHWFDDAEMARATEREKALMFQQAREQCAPYCDRMRTFKGGEVLPGVTAVPCHGHLRPGHLHYPGLGHVAKSDGSYRFVPEPWQQSLKCGKTVDYSVAHRPDRGRADRAHFRWRFTRDFMVWLKLLLTTVDFLLFDHSDGHERH